MASCAESANNFPLISRNQWRETVRKALSLYVGRGRRYSVKELSNGTGIPDRVIECALCDPDSPDYRPLAGEYLASLDQFLGPNFASMHLEPAGLGAFELMDGQIPLPKVLTSAEVQESPEQERKRLIARLAEIENVDRRVVSHPGFGRRGGL